MAGGCVRLTGRQGSSRRRCGGVGGRFWGLITSGISGGGADPPPLPSQPEVLHMIFMRILQKVYGIRLEHFYMVCS